MTTLFGPDLGSHDDARIMGGTRDMLAPKQLPLRIEDAEAPATEPRGHDPAVRLLDVV